MKRALVIVAVLTVFAVSLPESFADIFYATRDNGNDHNGGEYYVNRGARQSVRAGKGTGQETWYGDFDTAAMLAWEAANPLQAGQSYQFTLYLKGSGEWLAVDNLSVKTLNLLNDWVEGDSSSGNFTQWGWTDPFNNPAATAYYSATYEDPLSPGNPDLARSVRWTSPAGAQGQYNGNNSLHDLTNTAQLWGSPVETGYYMGALLDDAIVNDLLNNPLNRGLGTWNDVTAGNDSVYTQNAAIGNRPYIEAFVVVPEPATLGLLLLGGVAGLIRRRR